jgi:large subunit ribosomal protein L25
MAETLVLDAQPRSQHGSHFAAKLRKQGKVPAVLYGHKEATLSLTVSHDDLAKAIRKGARVLDLKTDGGLQKALISELQWDHLGVDLLHADFKRVDINERIKVSVPIELRGVAPGVTGGGVLDQPIHALHVECLAISIPPSIRVNIAELQIGMSIHVRELHLPEGVQALDDAESIVVAVKQPQVEAEAAAAPAAAAAESAEPEVIGRKAAEEEAEAE